tara:strand:- start:100 stop:1425 length:1326 start_codon:yes stop_codon:yes gene_type:complete
MQIYSFDKEKFPFDDVTLANPQGLQGGAFFSRLKLLGNPVTVQTPRCKTKNGIIRTEKKIYCDLMFDKDNEGVIDFLETIEDKIKNLIYEKKDTWFHSDMDMDTIDYHWQNILRSYKGSNILLRCFIRRPKSRLSSEPTIQIYDEDESLLSLDDITKDKTIMGLLEITGLKFTSQSFSLEFNLTQAMVLKEKVFRNKCLIKHSSKTETVEKNTTDLNVQTKKNNVLNRDELKSVEDQKNIEETDVVEVTTDDAEEEQEVQQEVQPEIDTEQETQVNVKAEKNEENMNDNEEEIVETKIIKTDEKSKDEQSTDNLVTHDIEEENPDSLDKSLANSDTTLNDTDNTNDADDNSSLLINTEPLEKNGELSEINLVMPEDKDTVQLKNPNEVYMEIYKEVKRRAKEAKKQAIEAYLEAKRIKSLYLLDDIESSDDENELLEMTSN